MPDTEFRITFWGVRGSVACPGAEYAEYGGNTSCIEVWCGEHLFILDGGTGLRPLGNHLDKQGQVDADILFTHSHIDHIAGVPFFSSAFNPQNRFRIWSGHLEDKCMKDVFTYMMAAPLFPVPLEIFKAEMDYLNVPVGETFELKPGIQVQTTALNHPDGATGYRFTSGERSFCYVTDTEHTPGKPDQGILALINGADLLIYDCTYQDEEFEKFIGWGHSTWQEGIRLAEAGNVKTLAIFHHDPSRTDPEMDDIAKRAEKIRPGTITCREGMTLEL